MREYAMLRDFVIQHKSQSHLCICNTDLFHGTLDTGIYGFPHQGGEGTKSFWRAAASMYNIGPNDLIFLYRTKGEVKGCRQIHGPFAIKCVDGNSATYYDPNSCHFPITLNGGDTDCKVRFLFEPLTTECISISNNFELIKKYESKEIWGYRHPAVMNIGAARKKSVTSFTLAQTLVLLDLLYTHGESRFPLQSGVPGSETLRHYGGLGAGDAFRLDENYLLRSRVHDEAFLYAYILRGLKHPGGAVGSRLMLNFGEINNALTGIDFSEIAVNAMLEVVVSPHLQDELDIVLTDKHDRTLLFMEIKNGAVDQTAVDQAQNYIDLLSAIHPGKSVYANVIGSSKDASVSVRSEFVGRLRLVTFQRDSRGFLTFSTA